MINSSQDLLYIVLSFCMLWLTIFLCWALYYLIAILRDVKWTVAETREKVAMVGRLIDSIEEKMHSSGTYIALAARAVMQLVERFREHTEEGNVEDIVRNAIDDLEQKPRKRASKK